MIESNSGVWIYSYSSKSPFIARHVIRFYIEPIHSNKWMKRWLKQFMRDSDSLKKNYYWLQFIRFFRGPFTFYKTRRWSGPVWWPHRFLLILGHSSTFCPGSWTTYLIYCVYVKTIYLIISISYMYFLIPITTLPQPNWLQPLPASSWSVKTQFTTRQIYFCYLWLIYIPHVSISSCSRLPAL